MLEHLEDFEVRCRREKAEAYKHRHNTVSSTTSALKLVASSWWVRGVLGAWRDVRTCTLRETRKEGGSPQSAACHPQVTGGNESPTGEQDGHTASPR